jgi:hypothetical protein
MMTTVFVRCRRPKREAYKLDMARVFVAVVTGKVSKTLSKADMDQHHGRVPGRANGRVHEAIAECIERRFFFP